MRQKGIDSIALALGLSKDHARNGAYGQVNGYYLCVQQLSAVNQYLVRLPAEGSAEGLTACGNFFPNIWSIVLHCCGRKQCRTVWRRVLCACPLCWIAPAFMIF